MITEEEVSVAKQSPSAKGQENSSASAEAAEETSRSMSPAAKLIVVLLLVVAAVGLGMWYVYANSYESTDDAQIDGHINSVSSRLSGTINKVYVDDNQFVQAGQLLVDLDPREQTLAEQQSGAQYAEAVAQLSSADPNIAMTRTSSASEIAQAQSKVADAKAALQAAEHDRQSAASRLAEAKATAKRDQLQADRYRQLYEKEETSRQEFESYTATGQASAAKLAASESALSSAEETVHQRRAQLDAQVAHQAEVEKNAPRQVEVRVATAESQRASVDLARAQRDNAKLNLSYTQIVSPIAGVVTQRSAEPGNHVSQGEQLLMVVDTSHLWVTANFKETQLRTMHPGCRASVKVDAMGREFEGSVESLPAITGSRSSVLPPENATGNYVKVVQRLPVRIRLNPDQPQIADLRPGMSVDARVYLK
jgi:membrane fusion protein (multidrug efflux system)